ncbi:MAG TPA: hypothetical protein VM284_03075 [Candidatus Limnocylindria bacterium]|nr:hypothetical protein [Candidatus Limnocylindria bacterium]
MIVVLGRPRLDEDGALADTAGRVAVAARGSGARVDLVGAVPDGPGGDATVVALGRAGVGHAALLRRPGDGEVRPLDREDVELGLRYVPECRVLVLGEPLEPGALGAAVDAAMYHRAALIALLPAGAVAPAEFPETVTMLELPDDDEGAFANLVGAYAAGLASGTDAPDAWQAAVAQTGWESAAEFTEPHAK